MKRRKKLKHIINWNYIATLLAIIGLVLGVIYTRNQIVLDIVEREKSLLKEQVQELDKQITPEWHKKFNNLNSYYENQLNYKEKIIQKYNSKMDSLEEALKLSKATQLSPSVIRKGFITKVERDYYKSLREIDSTIIENQERMIKFFQEIDSINITRIEVSDKLLSSTKKLNRELMNYYDSSKSSNFQFRIIGLALILIILIFIIFIFFKRNE